MYRYLIPEKFKKPGLKYIVYGYGEVGKDFCAQIASDDKMQLVAIVDRNIEVLDLSYDVKICSPAEIETVDYDYILIATVKESVANDIRNVLVDCGVDDNKVMWDGQGYTNKEYLDDSALYLREFIKDNLFFSTDKRRFFLFMLPEHGNIGDYAIGYAEMLFFKKYFPNIELHCVTTMQWIAMRELLPQVISKDDVLFFNGGGYLGDLRGDNAVYEDIISMFPGNLKIFFPNNYTYSGGISKENQNLIRDIRLIFSRPDIYVFLRGRKSYDFAKQFSKNVSYFPDMALGLHFPKTVEKSDKILLCLRNDIEKTFSEEKELRCILDKEGVLYDEFDLCLSRYISQIEGRNVLKKVIKKLQKYKLIITDRLHGMILSVVSEIPVIVFDNSTHKILDVLEWVKSYESVFFLNEKEIESVPEIIHNAPSLECKYDKRFDKQFEEMANVIKTNISRYYDNGGKHGE